MLLMLLLLLLFVVAGGSPLLSVCLMVLFARQLFTMKCILFEDESKKWRQPLFI